MTEPDKNDPVAALLDGLRPAAPSDELLRRLAAARPVLRVPTRREKIIHFIPQLATAAALIALASALVYKFYPRGDERDAVVENETPAVTGDATTAAMIMPLQKRQRLIGVEDLGVSREDPHNPVRLMRARWWDDETFAPPNGAPPVRQGRLRDEIVPVSVSTF